jgi:hypothetical protein
MACKQAEMAAEIAAQTHLGRSRLRNQRPQHVRCALFNGLLIRLSMSPIVAETK